MVFHEAAMHAIVEALGLPVPGVWGVRQHGDRWGLILDRIAGASFADQMRGEVDDVPRYIERMAQLHVQIHGHEAIHFGAMKVRLVATIRSTSFLDERRRWRLLRGIADMPDGDRLCHGDFHPFNILGARDRPMIIDWVGACRGDPAADVCLSYLVLKLYAAELSAIYIDAYCRLSNLARDAVLRWLPYVAAAKLADGVPNEREELLAAIGASIRE